MVVEIHTEELSHQRFVDKDFSGRSLGGADLSFSSFENCNFDDADLSEANCQHSDFTGSSFRNTNLHHTNFHRAILAATVFEPRDCFGMTITLECRTFKNMRMGRLWRYCWLILLSLIAFAPGETDQFEARLLALIGAERYAKLRAMFQQREL